MTTVTEAREALDRYVASDSRSLRRYEAARDAFEAAIRAEGLDVERLATVVEDALGLSRDATLAVVGGWAAEYARLARREGS